MNRNGFTLIELVVVITILGILAVTALPKFINIQNEAQKVALHGLQGALKSGGKLVYSKALLQKQEKIKCANDDPSTCGQVDVGGGLIIRTNLGYPVAVADEIAKMLDMSFGVGHDWSVITTQSGYSEYAAIFIYPTAHDRGQGCSIKYNNAYPSMAPFIPMFTYDC